VIPQSALGAISHAIARGPGLWQVDPALTKRTALTEGSIPVFRAEAFNLFNCQPTGNPMVNVATNGSGKILPNGFGTIQTAVKSLPTGSGTPASAAVHDASGVLEGM
jgi:hypothetical protein